MKKFNFKAVGKFLALSATLLLPAAAQADDTSLFAFGGAGGSNGWPATIVFGLDISTSMLAHNCNNCFENGWKVKDAPNGSKICYNTNFETTLGPDIDGDKERDFYHGPYEADGLTWRGLQYEPILDNGKEITYMSCGVWFPGTQSNGNKTIDPDRNSNPSTCGKFGAADQKEIFDAQVKAYCSLYASCEEANRCIYSMRTQGYYSTKCSGSTGDPYGACSCQAYTGSSGEEEGGDPTTLDFWELADVYGSNTSCTHTSMDLKEYSSSSTTVNTTDSPNGTVDNTVSHSNNQLYYSKIYPSSGKSAAAGGSLDSCDGVMTFTGGGTLYANNPPVGAKLDTFMVHGKPFEVKESSLTYNRVSSCTSNCSSVLAYDPKNAKNSNKTMVDDPESYSVQMQVAYNGSTLDIATATEAANNPQVGVMLKSYSISESADKADNDFVYMTIGRDGTVYIGNHKNGTSGSSYQQEVSPVISSAWGGGAAKCLKIKEVRNFFYFYVNTTTKTGKIYGHDVEQCDEANDNWKLVRMLEMPSIPSTKHYMVAGLIAGSASSTATSWQANWGKDHQFSSTINGFAIKYSKGIGTTDVNIPGTQWSLAKYDAEGHLSEIAANPDRNFLMKIKAPDMFLGDKTSIENDHVRESWSTYYSTTFNFPSVKGSYNVVMRVQPKRSGRIELKITDKSGNERYKYTQSVGKENKQKDITFNNVVIHFGDEVKTTVNLDNGNDGLYYYYMTIGKSTQYVPQAETLKKIPAKYAFYKNNLNFKPQANSNSGAVSSEGDGRIDIYVPTAGKYKLLVNAVGNDTNIKNITVKVGSTEGKVYFNKKEAETKSMQTETKSQGDCAEWNYTWYGQKTDCKRYNEKINYTDVEVSLSAGVNTLTFKDVNQVDYINWFALVPSSWSGDYGSNVQSSSSEDIDYSKYCGFDASGLVVKGDTVAKSKPNNDSFSAKIAYLGDWMNFNPRRDHAVASAMYGLMDVLDDDVRVATSYFYDWESNTTHLHKTNVDTHTADTWPPCTEVISNEDCKDGDKDTTCLKSTYREYFKNEFFKFVAGRSGTPLSMLENHIGKMANKTDKGTALFCDKCQSNIYMVLLTDGEPYGDYESPSNGNCSSKLDFAYQLNNKQNIKDGLAVKNNWCMDEVAYLLHTRDIFDDKDNVTNTISTYTISFALADANDPDKCPAVLDETAKVGGGTCIPAYDIDSLKEALTSIVADIMPRAMTYTAPSVAAVRGSGENTVVSSTFVPTNDLPFWEAHMFKFALCDEKDEDRPNNCECGDPSNKEEICIVGANGLPIEYKDSNLITPPFWDAQLCLSGDFLRKHSGVGIAQDPFSTDVSNCYRYASEKAPESQRRKIYTVLDSNKDGIYDSKDSQIEFMASGGHLGQLATMMDVDEKKAEQIIGFIRGIDVFDMDADGDYEEERSLSTMLDGAGNVVQGWWKLGDIFHSAPLLVSTLSDSFYQGSYRSLTNNSVGFSGVVKDRPAIYITGANDGMLHAFDAGKYNDKGVLKGDTGAELWAFIPPSAIGKFKDMCKINDASCSYKRKQYFVDSSPTYRDVWIGSESDDITKPSNKNKWKTVLIGGMRQGGNYYFGLDITDTAAPKFLWEFPPQNAAKAKALGINETFGQTWLETGASPSAVGTIQLDNGTPKWVALLGGGYNSLDQAGRGYYIIDPYTGELLYAAQHGGTGGDLNRMNYSFAATPAFTAPKSFVGANNQTIMMFTKILAIDHGGQVWLQDIPVTKMSGGKISNWSAPEVVFSANKTLITPSTNTLVASSYQTKPVFFLPVTSVTSDNKLRAVFGTGDRDELMRNGTSAQWDDILCNNPGRIYSIILGKCNGQPCTESDLVALDAETIKTTTKLSASDAAKAKKTGWYMKLRAGERVVNPPSMATYRKSDGQNGGMVVITTYQPTFVCDDHSTTTLKTCGTSEGTNGLGRLYMIDLESGVLLEDIQELDGELPADPRITTKVGATVESAILLPGGRDNPTPTVRRTTTGENALRELYRIDVSRDIHNTLHE